MGIAESTQITRVNRWNANDTLSATIVGLFVIALVLSMGWPSGIPRNDDFSYARTADALARTGRVAYNGWGSPLTLPQSVIGALLIKLFGFSYTVLDWCGVATAGLTTSALFVLSRLVGLSRWISVLSVALLVANPMFLGTAPTFMTDIPSLLLLVLALCFLVSSIAVQRKPGEPDSGLRLLPWRFWFAVLLGYLAGANRQLSWIEFGGALLPALLAIKSRSDQAMIVGALVLLTVCAAATTAWLNMQMFIVPTDVTAGLILLVAFTSAVFAIVYRFFFIFGVFILPIVLICLRTSDLRRPAFWTALAVVGLPVLFPVSKSLSYFSYFYGAAPSGQYFTNMGVKIGYLTGTDATQSAQFPAVITVILISMGLLALGISLYLMLIWIKPTWGEKREVLKSSLRSRLGDERLQLRTFANIFLVSTLAGIVVSIPWFAQLHVFDRYYLFYLPGFTLFFLLQVLDRGSEVKDNRPFVVAVRVAAGIFFLVTAAVSYAMVVTYTNCGHAEATLYARLRSRGIPVNQIDNGLEFDADAQVQLKGYINSDHISPISAYDSAATGRNIPSATPGLFPVMDGRYILSREPHPKLKFPVANDPVDSVSYVSLLPPGRFSIYVLQVTAKP